MRKLFSTHRHSTWNQAMPCVAARRGESTSRSSAVALIMVILVLSALAVIGTPFVLSMLLHDRASKNFAGRIAATRAAESARSHAIAELLETSRPVEWEREKEVLDEQRAEGPARTSLLGGRNRSSRNRSAGALERRRRSGVRGGSDEGREKERRPTSERGPSSADHDPASELAVSVPSSLRLPNTAPPDPNAAEAGVVSFGSTQGLSVSVDVRDEQGKICLDTAPPNLIANIFGVSQLAYEFGPNDRELVLDDGSAFRGDEDDESLDGAVVIVDAKTLRTEVVTYSTLKGDRLGGLFRGAFFSVPSTSAIRAGSFVWDLKGWKVGLHRFRDAKYGGFDGRSLSRFRSVSAMREIAEWQLAAFFVGRVRGGGLPKELIEQSGLRMKNLTKLGIDPSVFSGAGERPDPKFVMEYRRAEKALSRLRFSRKLLQQLIKRRGPHLVLELAARLRGAKRKEVRAVESEMKALLASEAKQRKALRLPKKYVRAAVKNLDEVFNTAGIETLLPEDLEYHRDRFTVHSRVDSLWSEPQALLDELSTAGPTWQTSVPRAMEFSRHTVVRLRSHASRRRSEYNSVADGGLGMPGGVRLEYPVRRHYKAYGATIEALQRHPVNVNTASREVLRAVFTGVRGKDHRYVVTPYEADRLAARIKSGGGLTGFEAFRELLLDAAKAKIIKEQCVVPLFVNAVQPNHPLVVGSTTGLCFASRDVYEIESRGILRSPAGREFAQARFREIVHVSPAGTLLTGAVSQADLADGIFWQDPRGGFYPEQRARTLIPFTGVRSHLVASRPLMLHHGRYIVPGADLGSLRLVTAETPIEGLAGSLVAEPERFESTWDGLELARGEPYVLDIGAGQNPAGGAPNPAGNPGGGAGGAAAGLFSATDLTMRPAGLEFWFRARTFPEATSPEGYTILAESGADLERNRMGLYYDRSRQRWLFRLWDASLGDPLMPVLEKGENGSFLQVEARRELRLDTWYHLRLVWDGVFGGGAQIYIDGIPAGTDNLSTNLRGAIGETEAVTSISVEDASGFPKSGVVRIGTELFEYSGRSNNTLTVRQAPASTWKPLIAGLTVPNPGQPFDPLNPGGAPSAAPVVRRDMRAPWNGRGSTSTRHEPGSLVVLHGYSLEVRRKIDVPNVGEQQVPDGDGRLLVWGRGGLRLSEPLRAWSYPSTVQRVVHFVDFEPPQPIPIPGDGRPGVPGVPGGGEEEPGATDQDRRYIIPMFQLTPEASREQGGLPPGGGRGPLAGFNVGLYTGQMPGFNRFSSDYFQSTGITQLGGRFVRYNRVPVPQRHRNVLNSDLRVLTIPPFALEILGPYPPTAGGAVDGLTGGPGGLPGLSDDFLANVNGRPQSIQQLSFLVDGTPQGRYPEMGIVEVRGEPTLWEQAQGRRSVLGQNLFDHHPDDAVEWMRYRYIEQGLFVGRLRTVGSSNFRGYPARSIQFKKQLDLAAGQAVRLVMELGQGGAGFGDYVTIATSDPNVIESQMRRVYRTFERDDGRFFVSLVDVDGSGRERPGGAGLYEHDYTRSMNPRLVKFPSWGLSEIGTGSMTLFGSSLLSSSGRGANRRGSSGRRASTGRGRSEEDPSSTTIDEILLYQNNHINYSPRLGPQVQHVFVPLASGRVQLSGADGARTIGGALGRERAISPTSPLEVLVVAVSTEQGSPSLFAQGAEEGVLRIGNELFFFEQVGEGEGQGAGSAVLRGNNNQPPGIARVGQLTSQLEGGRSPTDRRTFVALQGSGASGHFEPEGFAVLRSGYRETQGFDEIFYYQNQSGGNFRNCLRAQLNTPFLEDRPFGVVYNVTRRVRLVGRSLLGTLPAAHGYGEPVTYMPYLRMSPVAGPMTRVGLPVRKPQDFSRVGGFVLLDPMQPGSPWEIIAHLGPRGEGILGRPRDEHGEGVFRARFGTPLRGVSTQMFAYQLPYRYPDRFEIEVESESLAYLQKSFRVPGARWRAIEWLERDDRLKRERLSDIVIVARFDGEPDWSLKPTNERGGLWLFDGGDNRRNSSRRGPPRFEIDEPADQMEVRVYFRYKPGAYGRLGSPAGPTRSDAFRDDWKHGPVLESLTIEYEKGGAILRHEELTH